MITVKLSNPPEGAVYWLPVFMTEWPGGDSYYPDNNILVTESWQVSLNGDVFFRADVLDSTGYLINSSAFKPFSVKDGEIYTYDWTSQELKGGIIANWQVILPWALFGGALLALSVVMFRNQRGRIRG